MNRTANILAILAFSLILSGLCGCSYREAQSSHHQFPAEVAWQKAPMGLRYAILEPGEQTMPTATKGDELTVDYIGSLPDGTFVDSSYSHGVPMHFRLGAHQVIPGWEMGLEGMHIGEKRLLDIPPSLGFGERGAGAIPWRTNLHYEVVLRDISTPARKNNEKTSGEDPDA